jgi:hypothetical protein
MDGSLSALMDGEVYILQQDQEFTAPCDLIVTGWEEVESDEELDPFESAELVPTLEKSGSVAFKLPHADLSQGYACVVGRLRHYAACLGRETRHWEHNSYKGDPPVFSFQLKPEEEDE